jgi:hypothetical protein
MGKMMDAPANLTDKLGTFADRFSPRTVATHNNNDITMAKLEGPFHWHKHDETDDFRHRVAGSLGHTPPWRGVCRSQRG